MGTAIIAFKAVAPLFLAIFAGMAFSRSKQVNENWIEILNKYALFIGFPALIIAALLRLDIEQQSFGKLIFVNSANIILLTLLVSPVSWILKLSPNAKRSLYLILPYTNNAYLGMPVLQNTYGNEVLPVAAVISAVYLFWMFTLTLTLLENSGEMKANPMRTLVKLVQNPMLVSVLAGITLVYFKVQLPGVVLKTLNLFADSVTAVVLFSIGIFMGLHKAGAPKEWLKASGWAALTMVLFPFLLYLAVRKIQMDPLHAKATFLDAAMPLGLTPYALATQYKLETSLIARIVVVSTLLSLVIIPVWIVVLG